uniref:Uncharacterized protein n=1 Tax=Streptomyces sp. NBC_00093 TaxID=2975649 RepID=A0AAU2A1N2_9ACTN
MTPLVVALLVLGVGMAGWLALGVLVEHLTSRGTVPERLAVHVLPGRLPSYVREDLKISRRDRAQYRVRKPGA